MTKKEIKIEKRKEKELERARATIKRHNLCKIKPTDDPEINYVILKSFMFLDRFDDFLDVLSLITFLVVFFALLLCVLWLLFPDLLNLFIEFINIVKGWF